MARPLFWACAALLCLSAPAAAAEVLCTAPQQQQPQSRPGQPPAGKGDRPGDHDAQQGRPKWWIDPKLRAELGINDQQSAAVDQIWQKMRPQLRDAWMQLEKLEETLAQMTRDDRVDEATVIAQIEKVEQARAETNKRRLVMIYRMNKLLSPDQRARVRALYDRPQPGKRESLR